MQKPAARVKGLKRPASSGETLGADLQPPNDEGKDEPKMDDNPKKKFWAKPVRSRDSSSVRGPNKDGKEYQVCQVGLLKLGFNEVQFMQLFHSSLKTQLDFQNYQVFLNFTTPHQVAVKGASFEKCHDIACTLASMLNDGKTFDDMMICRGMMINELKEKVEAAKLQD